MPLRNAFADLLTDDALRATPVPVSLSSTTITGTVAVSFTQLGLTDTQLRASAVPVSLASTTITGSVATTGAFFQATQPVSGTFWQATQPVSFTQLGLTDTQLRATAVPVSLASVPTHAVTLASTTITGSVATTGAFFQATQPVSGTFWQATQPVSFTQLGLTDTQLRATAVPVSLASVPTHAVTLASTTITGSVATTGTFWQATQPVSIASMPTTAVTLASTTITGTVAVTGAYQATQPVSGTFFQATQPVSLASVPSHAVTLASTTITGTVAVSVAALTAASPTSASVGTSSAQVLASNANRKGAVFMNISANTISFGVGTAAVLNSGITLLAYGTWTMDANTLVTGAINGIASGAASALAIQEFQ